MTAAIILAGRNNDGAFRETADVAAEALVPLKGRPLLAYVLAAVGESRQVTSVTVVGPPSLSDLVASYGAERVEPGNDLVTNLRRGVEAATVSERILVATADAPMLSGEIIDAFLSRCNEMAGRFFYPVIAKEAYRSRFPGSRRTYIRLRDGVFTGGNLFVLDRAVAAQTLGLVEEFYQARKSPLRLARILGVSFIIGLLLRRLTVEQLENHVSGLVGARGRAVVTGMPEIALDVDRPEDLIYVEGILP